MDAMTSTKGKLKGRGRLPKLVFILVLCLVILAGVVFAAGYFNRAKTAKNTVQQRTATVMKGDISVTVTGSGAISSANRQSLTAKTGSTITKLYFKDGDPVKSGDLIMELDNFNAVQDVKKLENSIAQQKLTMAYNDKTLNGSTALSLIGGEVTSVNVKEGDTVSKGGVVAVVTDKSRLKLVVPFNDSHRNDFKMGQTVVVNAFDTVLENSYSVKAIITDISEPIYQSEGKEAYNVEVRIDNPDSLKADMVANVEAEIGGQTIESSDSGTLAYMNSFEIKSVSGGTVEKVNVKVGQWVKKDTILVKMQNDDLTLSQATNNLKLQDLYTQLETAKRALDDYKIISSVNGTLSLNDLNIGDEVKQGDAIGSVADYGHMVFEIAIDELDIAKVKTGQPVNVTIDALPETTSKPLKGTVIDIAVEGTSTSGVTTYPVKIRIDDSAALKGSMNANAEIMVESKKNVLTVPIEAVTKRGQRAVVWVKGTRPASANSPSSQNNPGKQNNQTDSQQNSQQRRRNNSQGGSNRIVQMSEAMQKYYAGAYMKPVEVGINNTTDIQIVSGLSEGDVVVLPQASSGSSSTSGQQRNNSFGGGGMRVPMGGGGAP